MYSLEVSISMNDKNKMNEHEMELILEGVNIN